MPLPATAVASKIVEPEVVPAMISLPTAPALPNVLAPVTVCTLASTISPAPAATQLGAKVVPLLCKTCPAKPLTRSAVVLAADWYGICPPKPPARLVAVVAEVALVAVAALPPMLKLATGVVEVTVSGAVPVAMVAVN